MTENMRLCATLFDPLFDRMDGYLIRMLALVEILQRRKFSADDLHARLLELEAVGKVLEEHLAKRPLEKKPVNVP